MAVKGMDSLTIYDVTDAYSVTLTNEAASFKATTDTRMGTAGTAYTKPQAFLGTDAIACSVTQANIVCSDSSNVSATVNSTGDNATWPLITITVGVDATAGGTVTIPVVIGTGDNAVTIEKVFSYSIALKGGAGGTGPGAYNYSLIVSPDVVSKAENGTLSPSSITLTSTRAQGTGSPSAYSGRFKVEKYVNGAWASTAVYTSSSNESSKTVNVPTDAGLTLLRCSLYLEGGTTTLLEQRTVPIVSDGPTGPIGPDGRSITSTTVTYQKGTSATTAPTGTWEDNPIATSTGEYLWTKTVINYSSGNPTTYYSVAAHGTAGGRWYSGVNITGTSTTATVFSSSGITSAVVGDMYLNTDTYNTYRCTLAGNASTAKWVYVNNVKGGKGDPGDDPYTVSVVPDTGSTTVLKNNSGSTTLVAHVFRAGEELQTMPTGHAIKWYADGTLVQTDSSLPAKLTRTAGQVTNASSIVAKLEG